MLLPTSKFETAYAGRLAPFQSRRFLLFNGHLNAPRRVLEGFASASLTHQLWCPDLPLPLK